ncbi:MAG: VWA domain-containing protein [Alphaproteobacteria bacterium]
MQPPNATRNDQAWAHVTGGQGKLVANIMHFARALRAAGLPIGPGKVIEAVRAVETVGLERRADFYWALHAVFVNRRDQRDLFDQAFHIFWRNPQLLERMMALVLPSFEADAGQPKPDEKQISRRVEEAFRKDRDQPDGAEGEQQEEQEVELDAVMTMSDRELLQEMDFEDMSSEELAEARKAIARMRLPIMAMPTRRFRTTAQGTRADMRATLRAALRSGGHDIPLKMKKAKLRHPPLVVLCDISGSMARYSRLFLHFLHAITNDYDRVHTFLFGTRLTNVTRHLRAKDVDVALDACAEAVEDWSGGTRIGACLRDFNVNWSRRVLGQGAILLLISDGLDRDAGEGLAEEMERLHKSCRKLIWLNPLLRFEGFEPKSRGIRAILPHVDEFRPVHNLNSLMALTEALSAPAMTTPQPRLAA